ncbi:hypothetical protein J2S43_003039 [Catenuloplanes nepalensis]|uniref:PIN domain-containing protein n=1 Tax=Catenuloplanes nepalensis TaxID=587533 RepID=A0ABT9MSV4_9ACTN|nr:hypothetical protein [Catenuloplanes nepalensis]MDP9794527.1 hypothetical protein [Catenuloplanes nepalensis]
MSDDSRPVRVVLDTSAILAYCRESVGVGELIGEIADENGTVGLPMLCLAEARTRLADADLLDVLATHDAAEVLTLGPREWQGLAALDGDVGRRDASAAMLEAIVHGVDILTAQPSLYVGAIANSRILELPPD